MPGSIERTTCVPPEPGRIIKPKGMPEITLSNPPETKKSPTEKSLDELLEEKLVTYNFSRSDLKPIAQYTHFLLKAAYPDVKIDLKEAHVLREENKLKINIDLQPQDPQAERGHVLYVELDLNALSPVLELAKAMHSGKAQRATIAPLLFALHENTLFSLRYSDNGIDVFPHESDVTLFTLTNEALSLTEVEQSMLEEDFESLGELCDIWEKNFCVRSKTELKPTETTRLLSDDEHKKYQARIEQISQVTSASAIKHCQHIIQQYKPSLLESMQHSITQPVYDWAVVSQYIQSAISQEVREKAHVRTISQKENFVLINAQGDARENLYQRTITTEILVLPKETFTLTIPQNIIKSFGSYAEKISHLLIDIIYKNKKSLVVSVETTNLERVAI